MFSLVLKLSKLAADRAHPPATIPPSGDSGNPLAQPLLDPQLFLALGVTQVSSVERPFTQSPQVTLPFLP